MTLTDLPVRDSRHDLLDRKRLANAVANTIQEAGLGTPLAVAIYGDWGSGKTSVMRMIEASLPHSPIRPLWFDAWRYARQAETLWRALLVAVVDSLRAALADQGDSGSQEARETREQRLNTLIERLDHSRTDIEKGPARINVKAGATFALDLALRYASLGAVTVKDLFGALKAEDAEKAAKIIRRAETERFRAQITSLDQFYRELRALLHDYGIGSDGRRLYIFVDDLDRCLPEDAVGALEAIKLFLDFEGCVFILGMDRRVIEQGIAVRYREYHAALGEAVDPRQYLDKIIQLPVTLPPLGPNQIGSYLAGLGGISDEPPIRQCHDLIQTGAPSNPRTIKRIVNGLSLMIELAGSRSRSGPADIEQVRRLAKLSVMQVCYSDLFRQISEQPVRLKEFETAARNSGSPSEAKKLFEQASYRPLAAMLKVEPYFDRLDDAALARLIALSARTS